MTSYYEIQIGQTAEIIHTITNADGSVSVRPKTKIYYC